MKKYICNYSIIRFLPYKETGEFVNIGVVACCPEAGFLNYRLEAKKTKRVTDFFPELNRDLLTITRNRLADDLNRVSTQYDARQPFLNIYTEFLTNRFKELVRPRESIYRFSPIAIIKTDDLNVTLDGLFDRYVSRNFAKQHEYQETMMKEHLVGLFRDRNIVNYKETKIGNDEYHVTFPFVYAMDQQYLRAIKPLNLSRSDPTNIREHGDQWSCRLKRLESIGFLPQKMLFAVKKPEYGEFQIRAANEICDALRANHEVVPFEDEQSIIQFAQQAV